LWGKKRTVRRKVSRKGQRVSGLSPKVDRDKHGREKNYLGREKTVLEGGAKPKTDASSQTERNYKRGNWGSERATMFFIK